MGAYAKLYVGKREIPLTKWDLPTEHIPLLNLIFEPNEIQRIRDRGAEEDLLYEENKKKKMYKWVYRIHVGEAKRRLDEFGLSCEGIDKTVAKLIGVQKKDVWIGLLIEEDFDLEYNILDESAESEKLWEKRNRIEARLMKHNIGNIQFARLIRREMGKVKDKDFVVLDLSEIEPCNTGRS